MRSRIGLFIAVVQGILILVHVFVYETWVQFRYSALGAQAAPRIADLRLATAPLSFSFIAASLLAWRSRNLLVRIFYTLAAVWLGFLDLFVLAACATWLASGINRLVHLRVTRPQIAGVLFGLAVLAGLYALVNAAWTRIHRITVKLPNLPKSWRGRTAALVSDLHLGHVRNVAFLRRIVRMLQRAAPDIVFIVGDVYDGTMIDVEGVAKPWADLKPPLGAYFVTGNHEEFTGHDKYVRAIEHNGLRVLSSEKVEIDGLQIVGVHYIDSVNLVRFRAILQQARLDPGRPSILLNHAPDRMAVAEDEGISLQLSGHTHGGQLPPFSWLTRRIYHQYIHGLHRFGKMQIFTNWGAGTWGPPMRLGTQPEIVLLRFD